MAKKNKSDWKPSENILKYLKSWEKFEPELYDDKKGNITIGYGFHLPHLLKKYKNGITVEEADKEFEGVVNTFVPEFIRRTPNFKNLNNNQRDALFSLFYNTGGPEYSKSPMLFKYLKEGDYDKAVKEINHNENEKGMGGQKKRRAFERRVFSTPTDQPWTVDDDSNYVLIEDKPVENESIEKDTNDSKYEDARHVAAKYGDTGYVGRGYDGKKVRVSDSVVESVGIANNADPNKWYESVNPILDTDPISLITDFIPTVKRMLDPNRERSGEDTATDFEEKMWKAYTDGDISRLPASKYRFDDDDDDAQYVGLPQEQAILIQSLLDKEYMNNMLDEAYKDADEKSKLKIRDYKKVLNKLNKNIFENPGKWILVNEGVSPFREEVYGDNFEKVNEASGLGALKNFSVRWDPDAGMLDVKDDYDFSRKKIAEDIIPERDVPLRIRERIKYDPKKGSVLRNNDKALPKRFVRKYEEGGETKHWWSNPDKRDEIIKRQDDNGEWKEKRRKLLEQAHSDLEKGEIDEDEFRRIAGFSNSEIGSLIISKDGNGEEIGAIINNLLNSIDIDKVKGGIDDAKEGKENKSKEDAYPYKLMAESLLTLADIASSTPGMLRLYNKMGLDLMPILKTIAESNKIQTIAGLSNIGIDGSQIALDPEGDNAFNYAGILGGAAEAIGGTNVVRNMSFMGRYGNKVDDILDIANPVISTLGIVDDVNKMEEGGETDEEIFRKLYKEDIERVKNGEKAMFFGELNDIPIEEVHPELMLASRLSAVSGIIDGLDDIKKGEYAEAFASGLLGFVPFAAKKVASYINKEGLIRGVLKDFNETIDRFGNDVIKGEKYFPSNIKNRLSDKHNKEIMEIESAIGDDRLLHIRPERVNPNGTLGVRNLRYYTVDEFRRKSANGENSDLAKVWWAEDTPISYTGHKNTIVSIRKDLDKMDMKSQKYLGGRDNVHVSNSLDLRDPGLDSKVYRAYYDDNFVPESHRIGPTVYKDGGVVGKQREAYEYFTGKRGMSKIQALAIIGNLMAESGLKDDIYGDNRTSYGIQQWHNERMDKLFKHAKKKGHSTPTFKDQLEFLADEYEGKTGYSNFLYTRKGKEGPGYYNYSRQDFMNADNLKDAVVAWNQGAGRPHKSVIRNDDRYNYAMEVAKNLGLEIEENSVSSYGRMGFGDDGEIAASVTLPEVEVAAALPNPEAQSQERQSEEERFRTWTETYGKDIVNHLLTLDGKKDGDDSDYSMMYKQHEKESEEDKKMALINAVLPNIQLRIKGVTDN